MPSLARSSLLVFSDLDGTLLDHDTYSFEPARPALERLRRAEIPLILATSKTLAETLEIREQLGNEHPCLVENGAAAAIPDGYFPADPAAGEAALENGFSIERFGPERKTLLKTLAELRSRPEFRFEGFADVTQEQVAEWTGLSPERAALARRRCCSEPLVWLGDDDALAAFRGAVDERGLRTVQGGRFLHVIGRFDKATGVERLLERYRAASPKTDYTVVALGDSPNDEAMLAAADIAVVIRSARSDGVAPAGAGAVVRTESPGPTGWNEAILDILSRSQIEGAD